MLPRLPPIFRSLPCRLTSSASASNELSSPPPPPPPPDSVAPPRRRYRDSVSVLRALASCVTPHLGLPAYGCAYEPWLGAPGLRERSNRLAKAAGRNAARHVARNMLANDLTALATETPRIDALVPLQTGESIRKELADGTITQEEAMDRLLLLLAPKDAWRLYKDAAAVKWDAVVLHRLLDLLSATNSGQGGADFFEHLPFVDRGDLPEPEELFYAAENRLLHSRSPLKVKTTADQPQITTAPDDPEEVLQEEASPTAEADSEEAETVLEAVEESLEITEVPIEDAEVFSAEPASWHKNCAAEQLWKAHEDVLRTPSAYTAIIRGAARFGGAHRAWELAEEALQHQSGLKLPLCVYNDLLRCAHESPDVWVQLSRGFELLRAAKLPPNAETFSNALYSLYKANTRDESDFVDKALGLMVEARRLKVTPSLGMYTNLLRVVLTSRPAGRQVGQAYRMSELLADVLSDLEGRWEHLSRDDVFPSVDDYDFATTAMICATKVEAGAATAVLLAQRIYDLVHTRCGDKRFLLRNSLEARTFYSRYLTTKILHGCAGGGVEELARLYRSHRQVVQGNQRVYASLLYRLKAALLRWSECFERLRAGGNASLPEANQVEQMCEQASEAFELIGEMVLDYVAMSTKLLQRLPSHISDSVMAFAFVDPWVEVRCSNLLGHPTYRPITERGARSANKAAAAFASLLRLHVSRLANSNYQPPPPFNSSELASLVRMALCPTAFDRAQETVAQKEANERAFTAAEDLMLLSPEGGMTRGACVSDLAAMEMLRACWLTGSGEVSSRIWSLLGYLASLKHLSGRCFEHVFVTSGSLSNVLDAAEASLEAESSAGGKTPGGEVIRTPRHSVVAAVRRKFEEHVASSGPQKGSEEKRVQEQ